MLHLNVLTDRIIAIDAVPFDATTANEGQSKSYTRHNREQYDWKDISILAELLILGLFEITIAP